MKDKLLSIVLAILLLTFLYNSIKKENQLFLDNSQATFGTTRGYIGKNIKYIYNVNGIKYESSIREFFHENIIIKNQMYVVAYLPDNPAESIMLLHRPLNSSQIDNLKHIKFTEYDFGFLTRLGFN